MRHRSTLAAGAALCVIAIQSTAHAGFGPLAFTMVDGLSATFTGNDAGTTTSYGFAGPSTNYLVGNNYSGPGSAFVNFATYNVGTDVLGFSLSTGAIIPMNGGFLSSATISWTVTFSTDVEVTIAMNDLPGTWTVNSNVASTGDFFAAGSHTFSWTLDQGTPVDYGFSYAMVLSFEQAGGAVPLPGAAGLAAVGLVGLARRRRR